MYARIMNHHRFMALGRASNWEMSGLRQDGWWRDTRWNYPWSSLADIFHPQSKHDFLHHKEGDNEELSDS